VADGPADVALVQLYVAANTDIAARLRSFAYNLLSANGCDNIKNARWRAALALDLDLDLNLNLVLAMPGLY
jgi:hypothetical protein